MQTTTLAISHNDFDHELRTPLTSILGFAVVLSEVEEFTAYQHDYVEGIVKSAHRLLSVIDKLSAGANEQTQVSSATSHQAAKHLPRVLLVEDDDLIQIIHRNMLVSLGCEVEIASSGQEALAKIENSYDLICMDVGLPDMSGIDVIAQIRNHESSERHVPILVMTAYTNEGTKKECIDAGANTVIYKPVPKEILIPFLDDYLKHNVEA